MQKVLLLLVVLGGCAADPEPPPTIRIAEPKIDVTVMGSDDGLDVCALAAQLPSDDICSLVCDPDAMAAQMVSDGNQAGTCYELYCSLTSDQHVLVGVCLPP